jgi:hypothetical protein
MGRFLWLWLILMTVRGGDYELTPSECEELAKDAGAFVARCFPELNIRVVSGLGAPQARAGPRERSSSG